MEKSVTAFAARRQFGRVLDDVVARGDRFLVERHGQPVAAVVPIAVYVQWKQTRHEFFDRLRGISQTVNLPPDEAEALAEEAITAVRVAAQP